MSCKIFSHMDMERSRRVHGNYYQTSEDDIVSTSFSSMLSSTSCDACNRMICIAFLVNVTAKYDTHHLSNTVIIFDGYKYKCVNKVRVEKWVSFHFNDRYAITVFFFPLKIPGATSSQRKFLIMLKDYGREVCAIYSIIIHLAASTSR